MGRECYNVYENLPLTADQRKSTAEILTHLGNYFEPQRNEVFERFMFNTSKQESKENFDTFLNRLRKLASTCNYGILHEDLIRDRIVVAITDNHVRFKSHLTYAAVVNWLLSNCRK